MPEPWRPILTTAIFTGLRASELRGLRWVDVDLAAGVLHVRQRADKHNGSIVSACRQRSSPAVFAESRRDRVPSPRGKVLALSSIIVSGWHPAQLAAGDEKGGPKYGGLHALRHFYASWCINSVRDGGWGLSAKAVQSRLGHSTIAMTLNTYSHLFPAVDEQEQAVAAERALLA